MRIAEAAVAAFGNGDALADPGEFGQQGFAVILIYLSAGGNAQHDIFPIGAMAIFAHAVLAALRLEMLLVAVIDQRVEPVDGLDNDVPALAAVTAVRAAELDELLAPKRHAAV